MGLHSGNYGIKSTLIHKYPNVWQRYDSLESMVAMESQSVDRIVHILDGNVLVFGAPNVVRTLQEYEEYLFDRILPYMESCGLLIVCFDEPEYVPYAKRACQQKRDKTRAAPEITMSAELEAVMTAPAEEECTREVMEQLLDCRVMLADRAVRMRFIDELCVRVLGDLIQCNDARMELYEDADTVILFDAFDARGTSRQPHHPRDATVFCTNTDIYMQLQYSVHIGEADLKLNYYDQHLRALGRYDLIALHTIDTDSIPISLFQQTTRLQSRAGEPEQTRTVLCLRERGSEYLRCMDVQKLCTAIMLQCVTTVHEFDPQEAMFAIACAWALGGCDFILPGHEMGTRPGVLFEDMLLFLKDRGTSQFRYANSSAKSESDIEPCYETRLQLIKSLRIFADHASQHAQATAQHKKKVMNCQEDTLRKAVWTASYWRDLDFASKCCDTVTWETWGFPTPSTTLSTDLDQSELSPKGVESVASI